MEEKETCEFVEARTGGMPFSRREKVEDMLEVLCQWRQRGLQLSVRQIGRQFDLSRREVTYYLKKMLEDGYIHPLTESDELTLTSFGIARGEELCHRHETFTQFLQLAGVNSEDAQEDACRIEHVAGEKTVACICEFINSGASCERILHHSDLRFKYGMGDYDAGMGIYEMKRTYPRRLAKEYFWYQDRARLVIAPEKSSFQMKKKENHPQSIWYMDREKGWIRAEETEEAVQIPTQAFEFVICPSDPIIEGTLLVAFVDGDAPTEKACRELNIHIS